MRAKSLLFFLLLLLMLLLTACSKSGGAITTGSIIDTTSKGEPQALATCVDSDGNDNSIRGTVTGTYEDGTAFEFTDGCHSGFQVEYVCENNLPENINVRCPVRCLSGACVSE